MRVLGIAPKTQDFERQATNTWFDIVGERHSVYSGAADPTAAEVPENQWILYRNTTSGEVRFWINIAGALKKSAAFT